MSGSDHPDRDGLSEGVDFYFSRGVHDIPANAIKSGLSPCGEVYVGVVKYNGMTMPCKIVPRDGCCYFPYYGKELSHRMCTYVVLKPDYTYEWIDSSEGHVPPNSVRFGRGSNKEPFAVGRVTVDQERCVGKILPSHKICYVPKSGKEHQYKYYDALIVKPIPCTMPTELVPGTSIYFSSGPQDIPANAITSGVSPCGQIYVGFVQHKNETMPAKIVPRYQLAFYPYGGREYTTAKFMFLVVDSGYSYEWVPDANGNVPSNAAKLGRIDTGQNFYVGRVTINDERCIGKILPSHKTCYVPYGKKEHSKKFYDVLVIKKNLRVCDYPWIKVSVGDNTLILN